MQQIQSGRSTPLSPLLASGGAAYLPTPHAHYLLYRRQRPRRTVLDFRRPHCNKTNLCQPLAVAHLGCRRSAQITPKNVAVKSLVDDDWSEQHNPERDCDRWPELDTWRRQGVSNGMINAMLAAPFAAISLRGGAASSEEEDQALFEDVGKNLQQQELERFQAAQRQKPGFSLNSWLQDSDVPLLRNLQRAYAKLHDKVYYAEVLPPVYARLSYARMMSLLYERRIKRIIMLNEGRVAIVEIPLEIDMDPSLPEDDLRQDQRDPDMIYRLSEEPEWTMDKERFYVELPGDFWLDQEFMALIKLHQPGFRDEHNRTPYNAVPIEDQTHPELQVLDASQFNAFWADNIGLFLWIGGVLVLRLVVGVVGFVRRLLGTKKSKMEQLAEEFGKHRAKQFNMGSVKM